MKILYLILLISMPLALVAQELPSMQSKYLSDLEDVFNNNEERELKKC